MRNLSSSQFELVVIGAVLLLLVVLIVLCVGVGLVAAHQECENVSAIMDITVQWKVFGGCFVEIDEGKWIPLGDYHYVQGVTP